MRTGSTKEQQRIARWIQPSREYPGDPDARIGGTGIPVWALVAYYEAAAGDAQRVADDYRQPIEAIEAALSYYRRHKELIDSRLAQNAAYTV